MASVVIIIIYASTLRVLCPIFVAKTRKRNKLPKIRLYTVGNMYLRLLMFFQDRQNHEKNYLKNFFSDLPTLIFS